MIPSKTVSFRRVMGLAALLAAFAGSSVAMAQQSDEKPLKGSFDQPLKATRAPRAGSNSGASSTMMMSSSDGSDTYTVKVNGDEVTAEINGKPVPQDRIRHKNNRIEILGDDGEVLKTFNMSIMAHGAGAGAAPRAFIESMPKELFAPGADNPGMTFMTDEKPPAVMMGITMSDDSDDGVVIDTVIDGLPADKAGVKEGDHITHLDGKKIDGQKELREIIRAKKPGDTLDITVQRDGKEKKLTAKLVAFDKSKLPSGATFSGIMPGGTNTMSNRSDKMDQAIEHLQKALEEIKSSDKLNPDKLRVKAEQALQGAVETLSKARDEMAMHIQEFAGGNAFGGDGMHFVIPRTPAPPGAQDENVSRQLEKLSEKLDRLNKRLDELERSKRP